MPPTPDQARHFIAQCLASQSIDFPDVAYTQKLSWSRDLKPLLSEPWFREEMEEMLEKVKFKLANQSYQAAVNPKPGAIPPPVAHMKEMMKLIDSGVLLGAPEKEEEASEVNPEEERRHLKRLGLVTSEDPSIK
jgi:hypothetical protein